jgi:hypothetical protein
MVRTAVFTVLFGVCGYGAVAAAQPPHAAPAAPCAEKEPIECPYGASGTWYTSINLKTLPGKSGQNACMFDRADMDSGPGPSLRVNMGSDGIFDVCNACDVNVTVQFDTWSAPWQRGFNHTMPPTTQDGTVTVNVPCRSQNSVIGYDALSPVQAKGWVRVRNEGAADFHDNLDPQVEIEGRIESQARRFGPWGVSVLLVLLWAVSRRRPRNTVDL